MMHEMLKNTDAVIFDLDGSLVDSMWMWRAIDIEYLGRFGIPLPEDLQSKIEGMSFSETAVYFKEFFHIPDSLEKIKDDWNRMAWDKYTNEVPLKPGIPEFLRGCREHGIKLGIATSNSRELVTAVTEGRKISGYFSAITVGCQVAKGKPAPDVYLYTAERLGEKPENCLVFEDIPAGILAGKRAGMTVWAIEDSYSSAMRKEKEALADAFLESYDEISLEAFV